ncbi:MAG TPA: sulfur carrier protein ThiS [Phycisphaerales bacterium]|nr:sulfur carrier protein ThiS [Phycisphaerales bacterium]
MPSLRINGTDHAFPGDTLPATVAELLNALEIDHATVVAEVDGQIVERTRFGETPIREGQSIELVRFVGGG